MLLPAVFYSVAYEHKIILPESLYRISHHTARTLAVGYEVEFVFTVAVDRIGEPVFISVNQIKAIFLRKRSYFGYDLIHGNKDRIR